MADREMPHVRVDFEMPSDKYGMPSNWGTYARLRINPADLAAFIDAHLSRAPTPPPPAQEQEGA